MNKTFLWTIRIKSPTLRFLKYSTTPSTRSGDALQEKIIIQPRIERGPTDILKALASTIGTDPTAAHYKYHDDPYLIPKSNMGKRTFAMAQEAGRKAAIWIRQQHPDLFEQALSDPPVRAFLPQRVFTKDDNPETVDESVLRDLIDHVQVDDATVVYELLTSKETPLSREIQQSLLELLCFYNCEQPLGEEFIEERWFSQQDSVYGSREHKRNTWKKNSLAEQLFKKMKPHDSASYSTIIQGMGKYGQVEGAWKYYEEALKNGASLSIEVYNTLIRCASLMRESNDLRWQFVLEMLAAIGNAKLTPNLSTLNSILHAINGLTGSRQAKTYIVNTLAEFRELGVEPSLASWYYVLNTLCKDRGPKCGVLYDIVQEIEKIPHLEMRDPRDPLFFVTAMDVCRNHLHDMDLAYRVDTLLNTGNNRQFIGDSYRASIYYRHLFALVCQSEPLETVMEFYSKLVPNTYTPEPGVMAELLRAVQINGAVHLVPQLWSDLQVFDHTDRENLLTLLLDIMTNTPEETSDYNDKFLNIAWEIYTKIDDQPNTRSKRLSFSGHLLSSILNLCIRGENIAKASTVMKKFSSGTVLGEPDVDTVKEYVEFCVQEKRPTLALQAVEYCVDAGRVEAAILARYIMKEMTLDDEHIQRLAGLVGRDALQVAQQQ